MFEQELAHFRLVGYAILSSRLPLHMRILILRQVLTAIVGVALLFRYAIKVWVRWALPQVTAPGRIWGTEDLFFLVAWGFDLTHMIFIQMR